jgi:hypothetical protein
MLLIGLLIYIVFQFAMSLLGGSWIYQTVVSSYSLL